MNDTYNNEIRYFVKNGISDNRIDRMKSSDRSEATRMTLWDKFKDLFRSDKKADALNALYETIHYSMSSKVRLEVFDFMISCAKEEHQDRFTKALDNSGNIILFIDDVEISSCPFIDALGINRSDLNSAKFLEDLTEEEKNLSIKILDLIYKTNKSDEFNSVGRVRSFVPQNIKEDMYNCYRPDEAHDKPAVNAKGDYSINDLDKEQLKLLNGNEFSIITQFTRVGYQQNKNQEVKFKLVNPLISFMLNGYTHIETMRKFDADMDLVAATNINTFNILIEEYVMYINNKVSIDSILTDIYTTHDNTLRIKTTNECRNILL